MTISTSPSIYKTITNDMHYIAIYNFTVKTLKVICFNTLTIIISEQTSIKYV